MDKLTVFERRGQLVTDSRQVAQMIGRPHKQLLRTINTMAKHLSGSNFALAESPVHTKLGVADFFIPATYKDEQGKPRPYYLLTRLGCDLVANKQTGERGTLFTAAYVAQFHQMETLLLERKSQIWQDTRSLSKEIRRKETDQIKQLVEYAAAQGSRNASRYYTSISRLAQIWQDTRSLSKEIRRKETDQIKQLVEYAAAQGSRNASRYYTSISRLADKAAGITFRNEATVGQLAALILVEQMIAQEIAQGIAGGIDYHQIYGNCQTRLGKAQAFIGEGGLSWSESR